MKPSEVWLPKGGKHSGKDGVIECTQKPPRNWLADIVSIGALMLTATGILAISDALQKKGLTGKLNPIELNVQNVRLETVNVDSRPTNPEPALRAISEDPSSPPTQSAVIGGLPGSPYQPPLTSKPAPRRLRTESDVRGWRFHRQFSAVAQKPSHLQENKGKWPKAFIMYLEAHQSLERVGGDFWDYRLGSRVYSYNVSAFGNPIFSTHRLRILDLVLGRSLV
jgi:hypothetical protein